MQRELKTSAEAVAHDYGFSSVQDAIRMFLRKLAKREVSVGIYEEEAVTLSKRGQARYRKMEQDFRTGKNISYAKDADDMIKQLHS